MIQCESRLFIQYFISSQVENQIREKLDSAILIVTVKNTYDNVLLHVGNLPERMTVDMREKYSGLSVLVVEDNAFTSIVVRKMLNSLGISQIETVADGRKALDKIGDLQPHVVLLDLRMPVMGGVELLSRLADQKFTGNVVLMSGVEDDTLLSVEQLGRESDISILGSLKKPPNAADLSKLLSKIIVD